jgi:hypothetical protein
MLKAAAITMAVPVALVALVASTASFAVVDVRGSGPDGTHVVVPVPLALAQVAVSFVPADKTQLRIKELGEYAPIARKILAELADAPDGELVRVEERDERVVIAKVGDEIKLNVDNEREHVAVNVPLDTVLAILEDAEDGELYAGDVIASLRGLSRTDLVEVRNGDEHVKVWIW